jgi:hypothetical protein
MATKKAEKWLGSPPFSSEEIAQLVCPKCEGVGKFPTKFGAAVVQATDLVRGLIERGK